MNKDNLLDEMQEQKLLKIEHNMAWLAFYGLIAVILGQLVILGAQGARQLLGELLVFFCLCIYLIVDCVRNGIWDRKLRPEDKMGNFKLCLCFCCVSSAVMGVVAWKGSGRWSTAGLIALVTLALSMSACWLLLAIVSRIYKKRVDKLENTEA